MACLLQVIVGLLFITYNSSKARATHLGGRLDHDYLLAGLAATVHSVLEAALNNPSVFLALDRLPAPPRRTLHELTAAGYTIKPRLKDPFTSEQLASIGDALQRYVFTGCTLAVIAHCAMPCHHMRWGTLAVRGVGHGKEVFVQSHHVMRSGSLVTST